MFNSKIQDVIRYRFIEENNSTVILSLGKRIWQYEQLEQLEKIMSTLDGKLFIVGIVTLILGSVVKLIAKNQESLKLKVIANTLLYGSYFSLMYYAILRLISTDFILSSSVGDFFKVILLSGETSAFMILFCIFMFIFGLELQRFGYQMSLYKESKLRLDDVPRIHRLSPPPRRY